MGDLDKARDFIGMIGRRSNDGAKKFAQKLREEKHNHDLRKRGQIEAKTESILRGPELKRYRDILATIAQDRAIASDERRPMDERMMAQGRVDGSRDIRNRIEKQARESLKPPKKPTPNQGRQQQNRQQQNNGQGSDLLFYDPSILGNPDPEPPPSNRRASGSNGRRGRRTAGSRR